MFDENRDVTQFGSEPSYRKTRFIYDFIYDFYTKQHTKKHTRFITIIQHLLFLIDQRNGYTPIPKVTECIITNTQFRR